MRQSIFYSKKKNKVKIAYIPLKDDKASLRENVMDFIYQMETKTNIYNKRLYFIVYKIKGKISEKNFKN